MGVAPGDRWKTEPVFRVFFDGAIASDSAFLLLIGDAARWCLRDRLRLPREHRKPGYAALLKAGRT
jgi:hypothetical protein